jgi:membrane-bound metal-dependent hydrolase YbcI (DUF457 family)
MLGRDHALSAGAAFAGAAPLLHVSGWHLAAGVAATAGAGVLPDFDEPHSVISRQGGFVTRGLAKVVRKLSGGHRKLTHSALGTAIFTGLAWAAAAHHASLYGKVGLGLFLAVLLGAGLHALRLGGHHGDVLALAASAAAVYWDWGLTLVPWCIAIGCAAHIAGDMCTLHGCPLLHPFSGRDFHLLPRPMRITTGKFAEHWIFSPLLIAALGYFIWRDGSTLTAHLHTAIGGHL